LKTILVVDDIVPVLKVVAAILEGAHFHVLQANSGAEALKLAAGYAGEIDLLLSDVQMPKMSGPSLGDALKKIRPGMRVMFMSGYTGGDLLVLNYGWAFIEKPFVPKKLVDMVHVVLYTPDRSQGGHAFDTRVDTEKPE
jgi:two-component system cell cycle sensor histidine kinase/response regulator CckA